MVQLHQEQLHKEYFYMEQFDKEWFHKEQFDKEYFHKEQQGGVPKSRVHSVLLGLMK